METKKTEKLKILLPKGRIYENVARLFEEAGITIRLPERAFRTDIGVHQNYALHFPSP